MKYPKKAQCPAATLSRRRYCRDNRRRIAYSKKAEWCLSAKQLDQKGLDLCSGLDKRLEVLGSALGERAHSAQSFMSAQWMRLDDAELVP